MAGFIRAGDLIRSMRSEKPSPSISHGDRSVSTPADSEDARHSEILEKRLNKMWRELAPAQGARRSLCFASKVLPGLRRVVRILETLFPFDHGVQLKRSEAREKLRMHFHGVHEDEVMRASKQRQMER